MTLEPFRGGGGGGGGGGGARVGLPLVPAPPPHYLPFCIIQIAVETSVLHFEYS